MRASAAAANVISNEQPCRVKLRIWRYSPSEDVLGTSGASKSKTKDKDKASSKHAPNGAPELVPGALHQINASRAAASMSI